MSVYTDLVAKRRVGTDLTPLLREFKVSPGSRGIADVEFANPQYVPVANGDSPTVRIWIKNGRGEPFPFGDWQSIGDATFSTRLALEPAYISRGPPLGATFVRVDGAETCRSTSSCLRAATRKISPRTPIPTIRYGWLAVSFRPDEWLSRSRRYELPQFVGQRRRAKHRVVRGGARRCAVFSENRSPDERGQDSR